MGGNSTQKDSENFPMLAMLKRHGKFFHVQNHSKVASHGSSPNSFSRRPLMPGAQFSSLGSIVDTRLFFTFFHHESTKKFSKSFSPVFFPTNFHSSTFHILDLSTTTEKFKSVLMGGNSTQKDFENFPMLAMIKRL
jgi:hypothetical protein